MIRKSNAKNNNYKRKTFLLIVVLVSLVFINYNPAQAQYWAALPPYNTLWPLWSPALSPIDAVSGLSTPVVNNLAPGMVLPVQPGLTWDPSWSNPWLLYNTPLGMVFYDPLYGINKWPPQYLIDPTTGLPLPINLPAGYALLAPTDPAWLQTTLPTANASYQAAYPQFAPTPTSTVALPSALLAVLGIPTIALPPLPPASTTFLTLVDILGYVPVI